ncbi:MAG: zf-HC2 domain-containing protein [Armatimonadota bacterium]|nr:zf-HC2 domain-containing protein [Armatimonadota bacterium]
MDEHPSDLLSAYADGALPQGQAAEVAAHLVECDRCRTVVDDLQEVQTMLHSIPRPSPDPSLLPRTLARLEGRNRRSRFVMRWRIAAAVAMGGAVLALLWPVTPVPSAEHGTGTWYFRQHAEMALIHPVEDVSLASYLSTPLPYRAVEESLEWR